jgi:hypothetical protein
MATPNIQIDVTNGQTTITDANGVITDFSGCDSIQWVRGTSPGSDAVWVVFMSAAVDVNTSGSSTSASTPAASTPPASS